MKDGFINTEKIEKTSENARAGFFFSFVRLIVKPILLFGTRWEDKVIDDTSKYLNALVAVRIL